MKFFEEMEPIEREIMIREAAAFNVSLEGMDESAKILLEEAASLQAQKVKTTLQEADGQTAE